MGLLTEPELAHGVLVKLLIKKHTKVSILLYLSGVIWFCLLAHPAMYESTYFSENALLAGLATSEFRQEKSAEIYYEDLLDEMRKYDDEMPYPWLTAKFRQLGLEVAVQNFTVNYPLSQSKKFTGKNVYAILRTPRSASTEAIVISAPYRQPFSVHLPTAPSIAVMLAFAEFATKKIYWSKDIIFLIGDHEQLGVQAWLEAYHEKSCGWEGVLQAGSLPIRSGNLIAALNLELHDTNLGKIDVKIEGLNGQLPNLDLFNLAARICAKNYVKQTFKNLPYRGFNNELEQWHYSLRVLLSMMATQATGVPNGNHGLFYRFSVHAVTLESFATQGSNPYRHGFQSMGQIVEGIMRSVNNLVERLHQSYYFYLLLNSGRFISIGEYIPTLGLILVILLIKSYVLWNKYFKLQAVIDEEEVNKNEEEDEKAKKSKPKESGKKKKGQAKKKETRPKKLENLTMEEWNTKFEEEIGSYNLTLEDLDVLVAVALFLASHVVGFYLRRLPPYLSEYGALYEFTTEKSIFVGLSVTSIILLALPFVVKLPTYFSVVVFNIFCLLELTGIIAGAAMYNFSLGFFLSLIYVPVAFIIRPTNNRVFSVIQKVLWILVHPLVLALLVVLINTHFAFPNQSIGTTLSQGVVATQGALVYSFVDSMIYGNWMFPAACMALVPNWLCFWYLMFQEQPNIEVTVPTKEKKDN